MYIKKTLQIDNNEWQFFLCSICTQLWKKKALLNKNMYVYSKSVLPAYLITKKKEEEEKEF